MATPMQTPVRPTDPLGPPDHAAPVPPSRSWRGTGFAWALVAPALIFMVVVHLIPTLAGIYLGFLRLNTFTLPQLFAAPWNGLENYRAVLFDSANPLHSGFLGAARNTAIYTAVTVGGTLAGGLGIALLVNREFRG